MSAKEEDMSEETEEEEESEEESGETEESEETESEEEDEEDEEDAKRAEATRAAARAEEDEEALAKQAMKQELQGSAAAPATGEFVHQLVNEQHDAEFEVKDTENILTPPQSTKKSGDAPLNAMKNNTHDAAIELTGETHQVVTPRAAESAGMEERNLKDQAHDIAFDVDQDDDARHIKTPPQQPVAGAVPADDGKALKNDTHDVAFPVDDGSSVSSDEEAAKAEALKQAQQAQQAQQAAAANTSQPQQQKPAALPAVETDTGDSAQNQEDSSSDDEEGAAGASPGKAEEKGLYDPAEYDYLQVSKEVKDLFQFITVYKAQEVEVEPKLHPFIPDYIPAIGDIDGFIKVPRPDGNPSNLGLTVLDEPGSNQSNASVVALGLAYHTKKRVGEQNVQRVEQAHQRTKVIDKWVNDMQKLHQGKHRPQVVYSKPMPDLETLLQVWPAEFEDLLSRDMALPPAQIDLNIIQYVRVVCALLDIPCYSNLVESVHVLLCLYAEFKANPHFQGGAFSNLPL